MNPDSLADSPPKNLLLVDDEPAVLGLFATVFEAEGFQCRTASSGEEALALFLQDTQSIDVLVTDLMMPGMNGMELAARIRESAPDVSVLLVSGSVSPPSPAVLQAFGNIRFVPKPFTVSALLDSLASLLQQEPVEAAASVTR